METKKSRLKQRLWTCETSVNTGDLCSASRFHVFTAMTFSLIWSSDLYYWKESWTNKKTQWDYIGKYTSEKRNELLKYWWKKHWTQRIEKDWIKSHKRCYAGISFGHFSPSKEQSIDFYSNQCLDFQYQKEKDQECTWTLRWNRRVDNKRREWEVAGEVVRVMGITFDSDRIWPMQMTFHPTWN